MVPIKPPKTAAEGARIPVHLAIGDIGSTTGKYFANDRMSSTEHSKGDADVLGFAVAILSTILHSPRAVDGDGHHAVMQ